MRTHFFKFLSKANKSNENYTNIHFIRLVADQFYPVAAAVDVTKIGMCLCLSISFLHPLDIRWTIFLIQIRMMNIIFHSIEERNACAVKMTNGEIRML